MHIRTLLHSFDPPKTPLGRRQGQGESRTKSSNKFSPKSSSPHSYPSPPMSESSPSRRSSRYSEEDRPRPAAAPSSSLRTQSTSYEAPAATPAIVLPGPQQLPQPFGGETRAEAQQPYRPESMLQHYEAAHTTATQQMGQLPAFGYHGTSPAIFPSQSSGPQFNPSEFTPPNPRGPKPARRTKAHVASACINCKRAHLSCDVQRPCARCIATGKQVSFFK